MYAAIDWLGRTDTALPGLIAAQALPAEIQNIGISYSRTALPAAQGVFSGLNDGTATILAVPSGGCISGVSHLGLHVP
jgi:hypothetical protein